MRNERSYNSSLGPTRVGAIQTPVSVPPETRPCQPPRPRTVRVAVNGDFWRVSSDVAGTWDWVSARQHVTRVVVLTITI